MCRTTRHVSYPCSFTLWKPVPFSNHLHNALRKVLHVNCLRPFHMRSLRRILGIRWFVHVTNVEVKDRTSLENIEPRIRQRRLALFGHVACMLPGVPAHDALWTALGVRCGSAPDPVWKRPRRRSRTSWAEQLRRDPDGKGLWEAWHLAMEMEGWKEFTTSLCCSYVG